MHNANIPDQTQLPTTAKLIKSTIIAVIAAAVILVTLVLPAEFGIDPTGVGKLTGLQRMGEIKADLAEQAAAEKAATLAALSSEEEQTPEPAATAQSDTEPTPEIQTDEMSVVLAPDQSTEIKLKMTKGDKADYTWSTDAGEAFFDLHADSKELNVNYHVYEKGTDSTQQGTLEAAFNGSHGWYWKNKGLAPITITLTTTGQYQAIKHMK